MTDKLYGFSLPFNAAGAHGAEIDRLIIVIHIFMVVLFVGWAAFLIYTLIRFRARPGHQATYKLNHFKTPTYLEVGVAIFEAVLLVTLSIPIVHKVRDLMPARQNAVEVRVVAEQFAWNIHYPGKDGKFGKTDQKLITPANAVGIDRTDPAAQDDIVNVNQLHVPINRSILVHLSSKDVIHSFAIPVMRVKQDAMPGQTIPVWFEAKETGNFEIACAQLCGLGHYRMRGFFVAETQEQFDAWLAKSAPKPAVPVTPALTPEASLGMVPSAAVLHLTKDKRP